MKKIEVECMLALRDLGPLTIAQLARQVGASRPTIDGCLADLVARGFVSVSEESVGGGRDSGRPAKLYVFEGSAGYVAGVDVGAHVIRVIISDLAGAVVSTGEASTDPGMAGSQTLDAVFALLDSALESADLTPGDLHGIGVGVTGIVGADGRVALSWALPAWHSVDIASRIEDRYRCPVVLENDARMASMAEHSIGASMLAENVVYVQVGHRLSISLVVDGKVHRGRHHASGEAGYLVFDAVDTDDAGNIIWTSAETAEEVVSRSLKGDDAATAELMAFIESLAPGIAALALVVDPDLVVIGGGLSRAGSVVIGALQTAVRERVIVPAQPTLVQSALGSEAVAIGGAIRGYELAASALFGSADVVPPRIAVDAILTPPTLAAPVASSARSLASDAE